MGVSQVRCLPTAGGQLPWWEYPGSEAERRLRAEATWFSVSAPSHPGARSDKCAQQGALVVDGWRSSFSVLENKGSRQGAVGALLCQGPRWEPDNVMVQMVEGGLRGFPGQRYSLHGGCAGLRLPAGSGSLARVGFWGQAQLSFAGARTPGAGRTPRSENLSHISVLCPRSGAPSPTSFLCLMSLAVNHLKRWLLSAVYCAFTSVITFSPTMTEARILLPSILQTVVPAELF